MASREELLQRITDWAARDDNIRALIQTGSLARRDGSADAYSDLDLELIARDPSRLAGDDAWYHAVAPVWVVEALAEGQPYPTRLVIYEGGEKVDFTLAGRERIDELAASGLDSLYQRGYRVILDKDGLTAALPPPTGDFPRVALPSQQEFQANAETFWFEAAHIPKYLARNSLWVVKFRDWTMKECLLKLLEWHAVATHSEPVDVWYIGSHLPDWVDARTWQELHEVFARFDAADSRRGLLASIALFRRLGLEIAAHSDLEYPSELDRQVSDYISRFPDDGD